MEDDKHFFLRLILINWKKQIIQPQIAHSTKVNIYMEKPAMKATQYQKENIQRSISSLNSRSSTLVVLLHGFRGGSQTLKHLAKHIQSSLQDSDLFCPDLPLGLFSLTPPEAITDAVLQWVDNIVHEKSLQDHSAGYDRIVLIGHSYGALLARAVYVRACSTESGVPVRAWASRVERIILLAGMNRGWAISHHLSFVHAIGWRIGITLSWMIWLVTQQTPTIMQVRRGRPFITTLRIDWLNMRRDALTRGAGNAPTIQLLGTIDDMVSPDDNIDLVSGRDFLYFDVPASGHGDIVQMDDSAHGRARADVLRHVLTEDIQNLHAQQSLPADDVPEHANDSVTDVVFVIHGIRDLGYWTSRVARRIKALGDSVPGRRFATETSTYGYFPMLPFLLPWKRWQKVEWLMDQYVEAKARYPNADFSFVGHSNGTYLIAKALEVYPCCRFKNVAFAGSVVRRDYPWSRYVYANPPRVHAVLNHVATADWVVAWFPKAFQSLGMQDLGSAGHDGFDSEPGHSDIAHQIRFVRGAHSAALHEKIGSLLRNSSFMASRMSHHQTSNIPAGIAGSQRLAWFRH